MQGKTFEPKVIFFQRKIFYYSVILAYLPVCYPFETV